MITYAGLKLLNSNDKKIIKIIIDEINNNLNKYKNFYHIKCKHKINELIICIILMTKIGITYRQIQIKWAELILFEFVGACEASEYKW